MVQPEHSSSFSDSGGLHSGVKMMSEVFLTAVVAQDKALTSRIKSRSFPAKCFDEESVGGVVGNPAN